MLKVTKFPNCCGVGIIHGFPYEDGAGFASVDTVKRVEEAYSEQLKNCVYRARSYRRGRVMIILSQGQNKIFKKILESHGFSKCASSFINPITGHRLYTYGKDLYRA